MAARGGGAKSIEHDLRRTGGLVALHGDEEEIRRAHRIHTAEAALDAGKHLHLVGEDGTLIEFAVVVGVLKDEDAVAQVQVIAFLAVGVSVVLGDPQATALVPTHCNGLTDIWFSGKERGLEAFREVQLSERVRRFEQREDLFLVIMRLRERRGKGDDTEDEGETTGEHGDTTKLYDGGSPSTPDQRKVLIRSPWRSGRTRRSRRSARVRQPMTAR